MMQYKTHPLGGPHIWADIPPQIM